MTNLSTTKRTMEKSPANIWVICRAVLTVLCRVALCRAPLRF